MITLWHNPRCSKSRQALALLQQAGAEVYIRKYLDDPPTVQEIETTARTLGLPLIAMMRTGEKLFREQGLSKTSAEGDLLSAMAAHPILIERPIAFKDSRAVIGRPPENVRSLL